MARELTIISGKGGTGKTSLAASFAFLAGRCALADCDVDAPDLHLLLSPRVVERHEFRCGNVASIRSDDCTGCGACLANCRFDAVRKEAGGGGPAFSIDPVSCEGCGVCVRFCPERCIDFPERRCGEWMVSDTRCGPMVHARLGVASGNSGKLVSTVRAEARRVAGENGLPLVIVDGPPGIGCPVIASVTGASLVLAVTEPTLSGEHDLSRVLSLAAHFEVPVAVCVNRWDLNPDMTEHIEAIAHRAGAIVAGRIRYDRAFTAAQIRGQTVVETGAACGGDIRVVWEQLHILRRTDA
jgi:MinD superfamily P-loop ATPase